MYHFLSSIQLVKELPSLKNSNQLNTVKVEYKWKSIIQTYPWNNTKFLQLFDCILDFKIAFLIELFLNKFFTLMVENL